MGVLNDPPNKKNDKDYRQIALLGAVPGLLIAGPAVGFFVGQWADKQLGTDPWMVVIGLVLGFTAATRQIIDLVKRAQALDKENDDNGT
jgi:F0F1-type ATP synthase assembly protein I